MRGICRPLVFLVAFLKSLFKSLLSSLLKSILTSPLTPFLMSILTSFLSGMLAVPLSMQMAWATDATTLDEIIVVASKAAQPLREVTASVALLNQAQLASINPTHMNEAMQRIAGAWVSRGNGQEQLTAIRSPVLTGPGSCGAFLMAQDGIPLRAAGFCNVNQLLESTSELAERIEVIKGPGSAVHGSNALHGVVNLLTPAVQASLRRIKIEAGPDDYYRTRVAISSEKLRLDLSGTHAGGYQDHSGFGQQKLILKQHTNRAQRAITTSLAYTNLNQETAGFIEGEAAYKQSALRRANPNPEAYRDASSWRLVSHIQHQGAAGTWHLRPYLRHVDMQFLQHYLPGQARETHGHDSLGLQSLWTDKTHTWRLGAELEYTHGFLKETQAQPTQGSAFLVATIPVGKHYDYEVVARMAGFFVQYQTQVAAQLRLEAGLRYEAMRYDYDNRMPSGRARDDGTACGFGGCRFHRPASRTDSFRQVAPQVGVIYALGPRQQVYARLSRGFRIPQATELYRLQGEQETAKIDPVQLSAFEVGLRGSNARINYDLSVFVMRKDNFIFRDTNRRNIDQGKTAHRGIEVALAWQPHAKWETRWAFTRAQHEYRNSPALSRTDIKGNDIDTAPKTLGSLALIYTPSERTQLELEWVHLGKYFTDPENLHTYAGHDLLHLRGHWRAKQRLTIFYRLMNLRDRAYAERADFGFGSHRYFVGRPRAVYLGVGVEL